MSDKQRADHVQAKYWNGYITRTETQKVFDDFANAINHHQVTLQKMDAVLSFLADKFGITKEEIEGWVAKQVDKAEVKPEEKPVDALPEVKTDEPTIILSN